MKSVTRFGFLLSAFSAVLFIPQPLLAQACQDDETVVEDYQKSLSELIETVKKESVQDFEKAYHQKSCLSKLTLCIGAVGGLVSCLDKAATDTTAAKEQVEAYKAKKEKYSKLKEILNHDKSTLKAAEDSKQAKALVEKMTFVN